MLPSRSIGLPGGLKSGPLMPLYLAFLPVGFTMPPRSLGKRWALTLIRLRRTHLFTLTLKIQGGIFSVALSLGSLPLRVTEHCVLWSSDFPLHIYYHVRKLRLLELERPSHLLLDWYSSLRKSMRLQFGQRTKSFPPMSEFWVCSVMFIKQPPHTLSTTSIIAFPSFTFDNRL